MEAMDVDESSPSLRLALIRAVRTLDEDSSLALPDKVHKVWLLLTAAKHTRLHGVEESILRWLLRQMSGNTEDAEHARRYPLTWTILGHIFPKIPAQALGRSLAYLRFVTILIKTLEDVTQHEADQGTAATKKRKRGELSPVTLAELRTPLGNLRTASEVFEALAILLNQGTSRSGGVSPEERVGAEHVKSLFSSSGDETRDITTRLLRICDHSLYITDVALAKGQQSWVDTLTTLWNLRLHSKEDSLEFARHIYEPASLILAKFEGDYPVRPSDYIIHTCREIWVPRLRRFLSTYFIRPARQRFAVDKNTDMLKLALEIAQKDVVASTTVMWSIAATTPRDASDPKSKVEHAAWAEKIFRVVMEGLQPLIRRRKNDVLCRLLDIALQTQSIPAVETLRELYQNHALDGAETDWTLVSKILACDADVFLVAQEPETIFSNISGVSSVESEVKDEVVVDVILPLQDASSKARDLSGFVTRWFQGLSATENVEQSIWFDPRIREHLATILQISLSNTQLLRLLEGLESTSSKAGALLVVLDGICAGLTDENVIATVNSKIISMMDRSYEDVSRDVLSLRWRINGYLASWETADGCNRLWKAIKSDLKPIIKKGSLSDAETFEAFSCCYKLCLSNHIGGKYEGDLTKLICTMVEKLISSVNTEVDLQRLKPYMDLVFNQLPRLSEQPKQEVNTLTGQIVKLFWHVNHRFPAIISGKLIELVQPLIYNFYVVDEEPLIDALITPLLDALDNSEQPCSWTQPHSCNLLLTLLEFPVKSWTRGRRKRMMGSWKKQKTVISSLAVKDPIYALVVLRLLVKIVQQATFYEDMEFTDLIDVCSTVTAGDATLLSLAERFVDTTIRQVLTNENNFTQSYLLNASQYAKSLKPEDHPADGTQILLLKSLVIAFSRHKSSYSYLESNGVDPSVFSQKLAKTAEQALNDFASEVNGSPDTSPSDEKLHSLSIVLDAARAMTDAAESPTKITLSDDSLSQLKEASNTIAFRDATIAWKLRSFLVTQGADRYTTKSICAVLEQDSDAVQEELIHGFVDAYVQEKNQSVRHQLLTELMDHDRLISGSIGPLLGARRLLQLYQGTNASPVSTSTEGGLDLAKIHEHFTSHLNQAKSLSHFKQISEIMLFLLDKHANAMTQYNIEATLTSVAEVCSAHGPKIQGSKAAGEIFAALFKLVALIIKRHRLRLSGHFHILLVALRALMVVLLADPHASLSSRRSAQLHHPPWLLARLQPRHAERFARLLTLVCEPSAASVARSRSRSELDSATDAAKRAAGQYMYLLLELYVKLQLEVEVSREMRKALEVGVFSVLDITSEGCRKVLNESLDAGGRAVFRALFAEYRKFGKWKGV